LELQYKMSDNYRLELEYKTKELEILNSKNNTYQRSEKLYVDDIIWDDDIQIDKCPGNEQKMIQAKSKKIKVMKL
jgi:hypothetical protein